MRSQARRTRLVVAVGLCAFLAACAALRTAQQTPGKDRGLIFSHATHLKESMECTDCHDFSAGEAPLPNHDLCSVCHDFDTNKPDAETCGMCHARPDYTVTPWQPALPEENKFAHAPHLGHDVACTACHGAPEAPKPLPEPLKPLCLKCHEKTAPEMTRCSVCHKTLDKNVMPQSRRGARIAHDAPEIWKQVHGREARIDPVFCAQCHDRNTFCTECHRTTKPDSHTAAWRRKPHGLQASWDRTSCNACHEEDSCLKCHRTTQPASHRGAFGGAVNTHCVQCHIPPDGTGCTACHEKIVHRGALPSPHVLGWYPTRCGRCHPGGVPTRAPHLTNSTVRCTMCHN